MIIECKNVTKRYKRMHALKDITFQLKDQKITGLIGRNGAGKTSILKILAGFIKESSGEVRVFENKPFNNITVASNSILVDDQMSFPDSLTLAEIFKIAPIFYTKWNKELANRLLDYFQLDSKQQHSKLSKGTRATFNMIFGLSTRCQLTMFDEPTNGMDEGVRNDMHRALLKEYLAYPRSILISSHYLAEIEHLLEDILLIDRGIVVFHKSLDEIKEYAVGVQGPSEEVKKWIGKKEVLHSKQLCGEHQYTVVINEESVKPNRVGEITIQAVSISDICLYVTSNTIGGIDDVFK